MVAYKILEFEPIECGKVKEKNKIPEIRPAKIELLKILRVMKMVAKQEVTLTSKVTRKKRVVVEITLLSVLRTRAYRDRGPNTWVAFK